MLSWRTPLVGLFSLLMLTVAATSVSAGATTSPAVSAARTAGDGAAFTIAVVPDTQTEVSGSDTRLQNRFAWLVKRREALDLRFVAQVGDFTNWGWLVPQQLKVASDAVRTLERAGIPYSVAVGNHDTRAVGWNGSGGYGGDAYVKNPECVERFSPAECSTRLLVRHTEEINAVLNAERFGAVRGAFEPRKIDNVYSTFRAAGLGWLVLDLELWPRPAVVAWANKVVAAHPDHNVVVNTHSFLTRANTISDKADYGDTAPTALWDSFVSRHPNIVMTLSGHVGRAGMRVDRGKQGNKVVSLLTTFHDPATNPVRLVTVDPRAGELTTRILAPATGETYPEYREVVRGMSFVG